MRQINEVIVHCTATPEGRHTTVDEIRAWHKKRGWNDIGYHFVVYLDGSIHIGRPIEKIGAHVKNHNTGTVGVVYVGGVAKDGKTPKDTRTDAQKKALRNLLLDLMRKYPSINKISGHNQYAAKACPSFNAKAEYAGLRPDVNVTRDTPNAPIPDDRYRWLQRLLIGAGYDVGLADGISGPKTEAAIQRYQTFMGLEVTGKFDEPTVKALREGAKPSIPSAVEKVVQDADKSASESSTVRSQALQWLFGGGAATILTTLGDKLPVWAFTTVAMVGVGAAGWYGLRIIAERRRKARDAKIAKMALDPLA